jgi:hypothetical protein
VPLLTIKVEVQLKYAYTGPASGTTLRLQYHGADTNRYETIASTGTNDGWLVFEVLDPRGLKTDPPYRDETLWRFQLMPVGPQGVGPNGENAAEFTGWYQLCAIAHRDPTAILT